MKDRSSKTFIEKTLDTQITASEKARLKFEESKDSDILINFIRSSYFALHEAWVARAIDQLRIDGKFDILIKALTPQRGERKELRKYITMRNLEIVIMVDELVKQGFKKEEAFKQISGQKDGNGWESIRKRYYQSRHFKPEKYVDEREDCTVIMAYPTIIQIGGVARPGQWEIVTPKEGQTIIKCSVHCTRERFKTCTTYCNPCPFVELNTPI